MNLTPLLDRLVATLERRGHSIRSALRPGLARVDVETALGALGLTPPPELVDLYHWHDGCDIDQSDVPLFGEHFFLPLQEAVDSYHMITMDYGSNPSLLDLSRCFPIAGFDGDYDAIYCVDAPFEGLVHPIIGIFHGISIRFENLQTMILTSIEWAERGVFDHSDNEALIEAIRERLNARIPLPEFVYVPPANYHQIITVQASTYEVQVGERIAFHATRQTTPFIKTRRDTVLEGSCWLPTQPPEFEQEAAATLSWYAEPEGFLIFDDRNRLNSFIREGHFLKPGVYKVRAHSADLCIGGGGFWSNTITFYVH